jgi:uncharacterized membrane-anchored protein YjiN (DUF445 family)
MKAVATGMLLLATVLFVLCRRYESAAGWVPYLAATAEAAMVGALADWFAVTALFRRPLGLPIPHTAIIPANKERIGRSLGGFVQQHFLAPDLVAQRVADARVARRFGEWLGEPANAARASSTLALVLAGVADVLDDAEASAAVEQAVVSRLRATPAAPLLARGIDVAVERDHHRALVDSFLRAAGEYLEDNRDVLRERLRVESPWWVPESIDDRIYEKVMGGAKRFLADLAANPDHPLRRSVDERLLELAERLRTSPELAATWEHRKDELLDHPSVQAWAASLWGEAKTWVAQGARTPGSPLRLRLDATVDSLGRKLREDPTLQGTVDAWAAEAASALADEYGPGVADFMATTVASWDERETSERLELQVGRDLQYIRLNGTLVGGLAGLVIYTLGRLL